LLQGYFKAAKATLKAEISPFGNFLTAYFNVGPTDAFSLGGLKTDADAVC